MTATLESPASLRATTRADPDAFPITFEDSEGATVDVEVTVRALLPGPDGGQRLAVVFPSGHHVSLFLPDANSNAEVDQPETVIGLVNNSDHPCALVLQCEQYLR